MATGRRLLRATRITTPIGSALVTALALLVMPPSACLAQDAEPAANDTEVPPSAAQRQARFDAHAVELSEMRPPSPPRRPRAPLSVASRRLRLRTSRAFVTLGGVAMIATVASSWHTDHAWYTWLAGGPIVLAFHLIGLPLLISGHARQVESVQVALHVGPARIALVGHF